jgi:hypothetical protein
MLFVPYFSLFDKVFDILFTFSQLLKTDGLFFAKTMFFLIIG